jgi:hypothetical protein
MILDATAGNRTMWQTKKSENIIYADREKKLKVKPTIFADNRELPFRAETFTSIFFDPPHDIGADDSDLLTMGKMRLKEAKATERRLHTYYGLYYVKTVNDMIKLIYYVQKELFRVLQYGGLLWLKWNEIAIPLERILAIFNGWRILLKIPVSSETHTLGKKQTYWVCLTKEKKETVQTTLL